MKIAFGIEYDGAGFVGWQRQKNGRTVQACVETALTRVADSPLKVYCAGRTDTGVHATAQVIHVETEVQRSVRSWVLGANSNLPPDVSVRWAQEVDGAFHARFSATSRTYHYVICNRPSRPGLWHNKVSFVYQPLDADAMNQAAQCLVGEHDFSSFRGAGCQAAHATRDVRCIDVSRCGDFVTLRIEANAFLLHMVRNIVGTLLQIGDGRRPADWLYQVLAERQRTAAGVTAPPDGLYLSAVSYPERFAIPGQPGTWPFPLRSGT